jgi:hypothetical protein
MPDYDELLQKKLEQLEGGAPLETVLQDLEDSAGASAGEIETLIRLATAVRSVAHPEPELSHVEIQRQQVMAAAARHTQPTAGNHPVVKRPAWNWLTATTLLAGAGAVAIIFAMVLVGAGFWLSGQNNNSARVEFLNGQVQIAANASATRWKNIQPGDRIHRGDRLRTLGASNATLVFFEGSHTFVSPNTELFFSVLDGSSSSGIQVKIDQISGEIWNKVTSIKSNPRSFFLVQTPSGTASVHGTEFKVLVRKSGLAQFSVNTGEVRVKNGESEVTLQAGQTTISSPGGKIARPTYRFSIQGSLLAVDETTRMWTLSGLQQVQVAESTAITGFDGTPSLGTVLNVTGNIQEDNIWLADTIAANTTEDQQATFTGMLVKNDGETWQVGGQQINITSQTEAPAELKPGDPVKVTYNILSDGTWLALKIESLIEAPLEPAPIPTATADPDAKPSYDFEPDEIETSSCGSRDFNLSGSLHNTADEAKDYAANVKLDYLIDRGGEYVSSVELTPSSWARIDAGQMVTFNIHVTLNDAWSEAQKADHWEDSEVKLRIFISSATNRPDHLNGRLTVTIEAGCKKTPTPTLPGTFTPTVTLTPEAIETALETPTTAPPQNTPTPEATETGQCTGANPHPTGMKLAQRYGVPYEEIMKWFCQHYGFGEIDLAYSLSRQSGKPVEEIFAMRASGMGWGNIKKAVLGENNHKEEKKNKGNK